MAVVPNAFASLTISTGEPTFSLAWKKGLTEEAKAMGGTLDQVIAAAIAQMISNWVQEAFEEFEANR